MTFVSAAGAPPQPQHHTHITTTTPHTHAHHHHYADDVLALTLKQEDGAFEEVHVLQLEDSMAEGED